MCEKENLASGEALQEAGPADETVAGKADAAAAAPETSGLPAGTGGDAGTQAENTQLKAKKQQPAPEETKSYKKLFRLKYHLPFEDYVLFQKIMTAPRVKKEKKRTMIFGALEALFAVGFLISRFVMNGQASTMDYVMAGILLLMGLYGILYYQFFHEKIVRKVLTKQYHKVDYFKNEITIDFYPNKFVEIVNGKENETYWHTVHQIQYNDRLYIIIFGEQQRCLLLPRTQFGAYTAQMDKLIERVCKDFEKPRYKV